MARRRFPHVATWNKWNAKRSWQIVEPSDTSVYICYRWDGSYSIQQKLVSHAITEGDWAQPLHRRQWHARTSRTTTRSRGLSSDHTAGAVCRLTNEPQSDCCIVTSGSSSQKVSKNLCTEPTNNLAKRRSFTQTNTLLMLKARTEIRVYIAPAVLLPLLVTRVSVDRVQARRARVTRHSSAVRSTYVRKHRLAAVTRWLRSVYRR